jgi:hypothetical protein
VIGTQGINATELEEFLKGSLKASDSRLYCTMANLVIEEAPQNAKELFDVVGKHMADAPDSYNRGMKKIFTQLFKDLDAKKMIGPKKEKKVEEQKTPTVSDDD